MGTYSNIKGIILKVIPKQSLFRYEYTFRFFYYLFYAGRRFQCNVCNTKLSNFVALKSDRLCPRCGSLQRTRRLWQVLNTGFLNNDAKILHFSPSRSLYRIMKKNPDYLSSDLSGNFLSQVSLNIKDIDRPNDSFDLIICYHILEHIDDDIKAMKELFRVIKKGGNCIVQTPLKDGDIYEDETITSPAQRELHFGQSDHVRIYSLEGLKSRLESVGFYVEPKHFVSEVGNLYGFNSHENVLICEKPF